jgi:hypothetical protein
VHFRAQIGQKCPLFASESAKKGVFCRGEGRLFGRPKTGVFGDFGSRGRGRDEAHFEPGSNPKIVLKHLRFILLGNKKNNFIFLFPPFTKKEVKL